MNESRRAALVFQKHKIKHVIRRMREIGEEIELRFGRLSAVEQNSRIGAEIREEEAEISAARDAAETCLKHLCNLVG